MDYKVIANTPKEMLIVGLKQAQKGIEEGMTRCVVVASDADAFIKERMEELALSYKTELSYCPTRAELGRLCRVAVPTAVAAIKDGHK